MCTIFRLRRKILLLLNVYWAFLLSMAMVTGCSSEDQLKPLKPLHVATGNWEPFVGENLPHKGPLAEMVSTILVDLGYTPEFRFYDWPMVEIHLERGYPSIAFPYIESRERIERGFHFSDPLHTFDYVLFYHKDRQEYVNNVKSLADLNTENVKIGRIRGYAELSEVPDATYIEVPTAVAGFESLRRRKVDGKDDSESIDYLLESKTVGMSLLQSQYIAGDKDDYMYLGQRGRNAPVSKERLRIMLSPKLNAKIEDKINEAIEKNKVFFDRLRARITSDRPEVGFLTAPGNEAVYGYRERASDVESFVIPRNSKVLITDWGVNYTLGLRKANSVLDTSRSEVKLLNGPLKGKVIWVDGQHITLER